MKGDGSPQPDVVAAYAVQPQPVVVVQPATSGQVGGAPPAYAPQAGYGAPQPIYGAPQPGYGAPQPGYGAPQPVYGAPQPVYASGQPQAVTAQPLTYQPSFAQNTPQNPNSIPGYETVQVGAWKDSVFACFNNLNPSCLCAWCCGCVLLGQVSERIKSTPFGYVCGFFTVMVIVSLIVDVTVTSGVVGAITGILYFAFTWFTREKFRNMFKIPGTCCDDCCCSCCCTCCVIAQMARHLYNYKQTCDACAFTQDGVAVTRV